jgi:hypothetical protein
MERTGWVSDARYWPHQNPASGRRCEGSRCRVRRARSQSMLEDERSSIVLGNDLPDEACVQHGANRPGRGSPCANPAPNRASERSFLRLSDLPKASLRGQRNPRLAGSSVDTPDRVRTGVTAVRGRHPRPLDDGGLRSPQHASERVCGTVAGGEPDLHRLLGSPGSYSRRALR